LCFWKIRGGNLGLRKGSATVLKRSLKGNKSYCREKRTHLRVPPRCERSPEKPRGGAGGKKKSGLCKGRGRLGTYTPNKARGFWRRGAREKAINIADEKKRHYPLKEG